MHRLCWLLTLILALATLSLTWLFIIRGDVVATSDGRTAIVLTPGERDLVLGEMRGFLEAIQAITAAAAEGDTETVVARARKVGMAAQAGVPASLIGKLPLAFKQQGFATHRAFDRLALDAEAMGDTRDVPAALGELMHNCIACHAAYRLTTTRTP